ncbi:MAG: hypothetical protein BZY88_10280 [SAR202 cluster bacterium Io17-Chloro-G9]|nr:MAG: hypothetical protein BZY88_10280 [SAR202 cluster bacterium Io17-Chloro-G9]
MIKAAALDLDGTIIGADERISEPVQRAIEQLAAIIPVFIATGREPDDVLNYARQLGLSTPQVSDGGAAILDPASGKPVWTAPLGPANAKEIVERLQKTGANFLATHLQGTFKDPELFPDWDLVRVSALDMDEAVADGVASHFTGHPTIDVVKARLPYNGLWAVDFTVTGVDKATGLSQVGDTLGVPISGMAAVGDSYNDLPMFRASGLSIAMGDAPPEVKAAADFVAPSVEQDGLAVAIRDFVLPRIKSS